MKASLPRPRSWLFRVYGINARNMFVCANQSRRLFHGVRIILAHVIHPFFCLVVVISKNDLCFVFFKWSLDSNFVIGLSICEQRFILIAIELRIAPLFPSCGAVVVRYEGSIRFSSVGIQTRWAYAEELLSCSLLRAHGDFLDAVIESFELVDRTFPS